MWPIAECGGPSWICVPTASEIKGIFTVAKSVSLWAGGWLSSRVKWTDHHFIFQYIFRIDISFFSIIVGLAVLLKVRLLWSTLV